MIPKEHHLHPGIYRDYFNAYRTQFNTIEKRYAAAQELVTGGNPSDYHSRKVLAAQWGDSDEELLPVARSLYDAADLVEKGEGQPAAIATREALTDIFSEEPYLEAPVRLDFGIIAAASVVHRFGGNPTARGMKKAGVKPPYLCFGSFVPLTKHGTIEADIVGSPERTMSDNGVQNVAFHLGVVSLQDSMETYLASRRVQSRRLIVGEHALEAMQRLYAKTEPSAISA